MEQADISVSGSGRAERVYEGYSWMILSVSAILGIVAAMIVTVPSYYVLTDPLYQDFYPIMIAWGLTWVGFNVFALILTLIPYRRGERWAWYTLWMLPLLWLSLFALAPDLLFYLVLAIFTAAGLVLPYRRFFSPTEEEPPRVR
jgi:cell division protein FtsW (lipid II flippase)